MRIFAVRWISLGNNSAHITWFKATQPTLLMKRNAATHATDKLWNFIPGCDFSVSSGSIAFVIGFLVVEEVVIMADVNLNDNGVDVLLTSLIGCRPSSFKVEFAARFFGILVIFAIMAPSRFWIPWLGCKYGRRSALLYDQQVPEIKPFWWTCYLVL